MPQGVLPVNYAPEFPNSGVTSLAGLPTYLELSHVLGMADSIEGHVKLREGTQGYSDRQMVMALVLLNLAGGDCVEDLERLEEDAGFARVLRRVETAGMSRGERRALERRWRKERHRSVPSPSAVFRYLEGFCEPEEEAKRGQGAAFIPLPSGGLLGLRRVNQELVAGVQARSPQKEATLDLDATLVEVHKKEALFCYKKFRAYQPISVYWYEQGVVVHSEFRDGNVPAEHENLRILEEALGMLPEGVEKVSVRSDPAGYQVELLRFLAEGKHPRFGVMEFAIGADVTPALKQEVARLPESAWQPLKKWEEKAREWKPTRQEWAEVVYVPEWVARKKSNPEYRYLVVRERLEQQVLPGMTEQLELELKCPTMEMGSGDLYKLRALVTNREIPGDEVIRWYRQRCGKGEEVHSVMKEDLAGGQLPSARFGANAAWWAIMVLAYNLHMAMKQLVLERLQEGWVSRRLKAVRYWLISLPGRVVEHARGLLVRVGARRAWELVRRVRGAILGLRQPVPT